MDDVDNADDAVDSSGLFLPMVPACRGAETGRLPCRGGTGGSASDMFATCLRHVMFPRTLSFFTALWYISARLRLSGARFSHAVEPVAISFELSGA